MAVFTGQISTFTSGIKVDIEKGLMGSMVGALNRVIF